MMHLAVTNTPVEAAWAAFDTAALQLHRLYGPTAAIDDSPAERGARFTKAMEVVRLWGEFQRLFDDVSPHDPRPAA